MIAFFDPIVTDPSRTRIVTVILHMKNTEECNYFETKICDGKADAAVYWPSLGQWWILRSSDGTNFAATFGTSSDKPVAADYEKGSKTDIAIWRPSNGNYLVLRSSENFATFYGFPFGATGDIPVGSVVVP